MDRSIYCLVRSSKQATSLVDHLREAGFVNEEISILYPNQKGNAKDFNGQTQSKFKTEKHSKAPEGGVAGATAGGILGGSLGLLAGIGALAIPGVGPFIAAGPIMGALSGSAVGGSLGLLLGALIGSGVPEYEAKKYESALREGKILISVRTHDDEEMSRATEIMKKNGGEDISSTREKTKSSY